MNYFYLLLLLTLISCHPPIKRLPQSSHLFARGESKGKIDQKLKEASGLVRSVNNPGMLWSINDSGNSSDVFLLNDEAKVIRTFHLKIHNRDWEDLTIYTDSLTKKNLLVIGDVGDNQARRKTKIIYWMEEPFCDQLEEAVPPPDSLTIVLSDGPRDMEALVIDPVSADLYLFSKREDSVGLYVLAKPFDKTTQLAQKIATLPFTSLVAADISPSGKELIIKDYNNIYYWTRDLHQRLEEVVLLPPVILPCEYEMQGESLCFSVDGKGYFTLSESVFYKRAKLFYYQRK